MAQNKSIIYLMYESSPAESELPDISLNFRVLSTYSLFAQDHIFIAINDPDLSSFSIITKDFLPSVGIVKAMAKEYDPNENKFKLRQGEPQTLKQEYINASIWYENLLFKAANESGITDDLEALLWKEEDRKSFSVEKFGELKNQADLEDKCLLREGTCVVGLLPAMDSEELKNQVDTLKKVMATSISEEQESLRERPSAFSWVNTTCHPEVLTQFSVKTS
mmetsp:Transcript_10290/g.15710  ORF Transcript_10290/g.15710 Transcript_10290/m.15710 type:complete len:221 (+) Transcript_10290:1445-2107(+)